jgi:hypothetical protein
MLHIMLCPDEREVSKIPLVFFVLKTSQHTENTSFLLIVLLVHRFENHVFKQ